MLVNQQVISDTINNKLSKFFKNITLNKHNYFTNGRFLIFFIFRKSFTSQEIYWPTYHDGNRLGGTQSDHRGNILQVLVSYKGNLGSYVGKWGSKCLS